MSNKVAKSMFYTRVPLTPTLGLGSIELNKQNRFGFTKLPYKYSKSLHNNFKCII